jgi:hypothetical protein
MKHARLFYLIPAWIVCYAIEYILDVITFVFEIMLDPVRKAERYLRRQIKSTGRSLKNKWKKKVRR